MATRRKNRAWKLLLLLGLVAAGIIAARASFIDWEWMLRQGEGIAGRWWAPPIMIATMAAFYLFALPGSMFFVIAGLLYQPLKATAIVAAGGVLGGLSARAFARRLAGLPEEKERETSRIIRFMERHSDFLTLCAIRTLPFFPHSAINYGAGILGIPVGRFAIATAIGFSLKGFLYASAVHRAVKASGMSDPVDASVLVTLAALAALLIIGRFLYKRWMFRNS